MADDLSGLHDEFTKSLVEKYGDEEYSVTFNFTKDDPWSPWMTISHVKKRKWWWGNWLKIERKQHSETKEFYYRINVRHSFDRVDDVASFKDWMLKLAVTFFNKREELVGKKDLRISFGKTWLDLGSDPWLHQTFANEMHRLFLADYTMNEGPYR